MSAHWTPAEIAEVTRRLASGQTQVEVGLAMGRTRNAIKLLLGRERERGKILTAPGLRWSQAEHDIAAAMRAAGLNDAAIGARLGRTALAVKNYRQKQGPAKQQPVLGMPPAPRPYTAAELAWAKARPLHPEAVMIRAMHQRMSPAEWLGMIRAAAARQSAAQGQGRGRKLGGDVPAEMAAQVALQPRYEGAV